MPFRAFSVGLGLALTFAPAGEAPGQSSQPAGSKTAKQTAAAEAKTEGEQASSVVTKTPAAAAKAGSEAETDTTDPLKAAASSKKPKTEVATFGEGCFWSTEAVFERVKGVKNVTSGFSGGVVANPSYEQVCSGQTGHAEVVQVEFDPSVIPYEKVLAVFWASHDPTTLNAQGDDFGHQYRSIIFYHSEAQKQAALKSYRELTARHAYRVPIVTDLQPYKAFYPADAYHQDYYRNHLDSEYSFTHIEPKLRKLRSKLK